MLIIYLALYIQGYALQECIYKTKYKKRNLHIVYVGNVIAPSCSYRL